MAMNSVYSDVHACFNSKNWFHSIEFKSIWTQYMYIMILSLDHLTTATIVGISNIAQ